MMGGGMRGHGRGMQAMKKPDKAVIKRLLSYLKPFRLRLSVVLVCLLISAVAGVIGAMFLRTLIDGYITPMLISGSRDFAGLLQAVLTMGAVFVCGAVAGFTSNFLMVAVGQNTLKNSTFTTRYSSSMMWQEGDTFGYDTFVDFTLNNGEKLGYKFEVTDMNEEDVTIKFSLA